MAIPGTAFETIEEFLKAIEEDLIDPDELAYVVDNNEIRFVGETGKTVYVVAGQDALHDLAYLLGVSEEISP